ncbi:helix-turn-helix domain-containing protein [Enterobacter hormaechei]|uniref:helix-turn-helix domain-containing protein n=1 Tax=Enterobacter hormaechei TaxID=158836 RepID=UPI0006435ADF|nr:helix-turn-helix domain-containing protein [Enterobacter hormaechei]AWS78577.1 transcriptional regulator [Enterobacter cloacae complex sp.]AXO43567.1 helix-turn-helix domain-containing protein [Enterobacter hormaechei]KLR17963.1 transcriptional regulator [Enterobacter hormaechei subsp. hormaechei]MDV5370132.1 helix-turn-helix domain-containing protein [Enterobacter hormaechei]MDV5636525.1 helix-turn-helix domain-containing protein [Enterobacter hormaechei]
MKTMSEIIGERLKALREHRKLSQAQLSKLCGWATGSRIGNYELGVRNIGVDDAIILARVLDTSPSYILFGDETSKGQELPEKQRRMLKLFTQLPESEQDKMIDLFEIRLREIDEYVEKYLKGRFKPDSE